MIKTIPQKSLKGLSAQELEMAEALDAFVRHARGEKVPGLKVERHPRRINARGFKAVRLGVFKVTQAEMADLLDVSLDTIRAYEQGRNPIPGPVSAWIRAAVKKPKIVVGLLKELAA